jgi:uncharacterized surface protein with fasciclin (FAS1) repeats
MMAGALVAGLALSAAACTKPRPPHGGPSTTKPAPATTTTKPAPAQKDIVDTAVAAGSFNTLAALLTKAGLVETLKGPGPFTVFAPTDAAFAKIPPATLEALGNDPAKLTEVLTYHVVAGRVLAADVKTGAVPTVAGKPLDIVVGGGMVMVNDAMVTATDVLASNGVIHVIDTVLLPPA